MAAQALNVRVAVAATLAETIRDIKRYKEKPNPSKRLLQVKLDKLIADKDDLFAKHCLYAELSKKSLEAEEEWVLLGHHCTAKVLYSWNLGGTRISPTTTSTESPVNSRVPATAN